MDQLCVIMHQMPPHDFHLLVAGFDVEVLKESYNAVKWFICDMVTYDLEILLTEGE